MAQFKKEIKLFDAVMLVAGTMIGSGIFLVSADIARQVGSVGYLLLVWLLSGFITMAGALSYGELTSMMPQAGGQYVFLREAYGKLIAFLYGWTLFLVIQTGTIAAVGVAFAKYTGVLIPFISEHNILFTIGSVKITTVNTLAIAIIMLLTYINSRGVHQGKIIQNVFGSTKIIAIIVLVLVGFMIGTNAEVIKENFGHLWDAHQVQTKDGKIISDTSLAGTALLIAIGTAMVGGLFSSDAWNNVSFAGDEIVNPKRNIALSLAIGTGLVTLIYIAVNCVYITALPINGNPEGQSVMERGISFATNDRVAVAAAELIGGPVLITVMAVLIMVSTFGCNNGCILSGARVYYKMAEDGLFFRKLSLLNNKNVPANALWLQGVWASILCLSGSYGNLLDYVMFSVLIFYVFTVVGIFILRVKRPDAERPYKAFGYPVIPAIYIILVLCVCGVLLIEKPQYSWPGLIIIALGVPVYFFFRKQQEVK
jgi:basic amino acid/polyamine antiporter, APA family